MEEVKGLISIVIPAYNAAFFITDTIQSVIDQSFHNWELWVINDGSSDETEQKVNAFNDTRIRLVNQKNSGVSVARNRGLELSKGEFIIFFDADDLMTKDFLKLRAEYLLANTEIGFAGGRVETFPREKKTYKPAAEDPEREILFFDPGCVTVPSNYLFRKIILSVNHIVFNTALSSTADRFFIIQLSCFSKGKFIDSENGKLLYRVNENSMSHRLSPALLLDNEKFYFELKKNNLLPQKKRAKFNSIYFRGLAIGFARVKNFKRAFLYFAKTIWADPFIFFKWPKK